MASYLSNKFPIALSGFSRLDEDARCTVKLRFVGRRIFPFFFLFLVFCFIRNFFIPIFLDTVRRTEERGRGRKIVLTCNRVSLVR